MALITSTDWIDAPDSDGIWLCLHKEVQEVRVICLFAEARHNSGWSTNLGEEWNHYDDYLYAKLADFPSGMTYRYVP